MQCQGQDTGVVVWAEADITGNCVRRPRQATHLNTDGSTLTYDGSHADTDDVVLAHEKIRVTVTDAGAGYHEGTFRFWVGR